MLNVFVKNEQQELRTVHDGKPLEFGRSDRTHNEQKPARKIALKDEFTSRHQLRVEEPRSGVLALINLSSQIPITLSDGRAIGPGEVLVLEHEPFVSVSFGQTRIDFENESDALQYQTIAAPPTPSQSGDTAVFQLDQAASSSDLMARWFDELIAIGRAAASSDDFYDRAARAMVNLIGFDHGMVLMLENEQWQPIAAYPADPGQISHSLLEKVRNEKRTFFCGSDESASIAESGMTVAASPIFNPSGTEVIGAVYGMRGLTSQSHNVCSIEAQMLQCLGGLAGVGAARISYQTDAVKRKAQFAQHFTSELADELERDPTLLDGREREITVMFSDVRKFSTISSRLSPQATCRLVGDIMEALTAVIRRHDGVLVDYIGDGLIAIWNAPKDQPNHASLACMAAIEMVSALHEVDATWRDQIGANIQIGVGLNSGPALVGNTGTKFKLKYGPLGHTVNLASRVEGATKYMGVPVMITGGTKALIKGDLTTRRLCRARVVGINEPVELHQLAIDDPSGKWAEDCATYEEGLRLYEAGEWYAACNKLLPLIQQSDSNLDVPSLVLSQRAMDCLQREPQNFDSVINLDSK